MTVSFGGTPFRVKNDEGRLPAPKSSDGFKRYDATLIVASTANYNALFALRSVVTLGPAMGMMDGGFIVVEKGGGMGTLTIPTPAGEVSYDAVLVDWDPQFHYDNEAAYLVDAGFILGDEQ